MFGNGVMLDKKSEYCHCCFRVSCEIPNWSLKMIFHDYPMAEVLWALLILEFYCSSLVTVAVCGTFPCLFCCSF